MGNYVIALEYGLARLESLPVSLRLVRELHERLMRGVRGDVATPGEFRRSQNWIGSPGATLNDATYVPPPPPELMACLDAWERFMHEETLPPLLHAAIAHVQFEAIHPFLDGNGRVGRLLITLSLVAQGVLPSPLLYLSAWFEATRDEYYARLLAVTQRGEWEEWLTYFLRGVTRLSDDAVGRLQRLDDLLAGWRRELAGARSRQPELALDLFAENPFWAVGGVAERLGVAFTTAQRAIDRLVEAGIVAQVGEAQRNRVYCAGAVLDLLEEEPRFPTNGVS
ncbi:MAG: Fic family protein [Chloroflexi bacterium]|nr:Fic family protein [Chloroflexota bacterium]